MDDGDYEDSYIRDASAHLQSIHRNIARLVDVLARQRPPHPYPAPLEPATSDRSDRSDRSESGSELSQDEEQDQDDNLQELDFVPEARQCTLGKYRELIKGESRPVLDYLVAGNELESEISVWEEHNAAVLPPKPSETQEEDLHDSMIHPREATMPRNSREDKWIHSIRINSPVVIRVLRQLSEDEGIAMPQRFERQPVVFDRPFAFLIHHQAKMGARLSELRNRVETPEESSEVPLDFPYEPSDQVRALKQIQSYVEFVEDKVVPESEKWTKAAEPGLKQQLPRIRFEELWYLFQPGALVYSPPNSRMNGNRSIDISIDIACERSAAASALVQAGWPNPWHIRSCGQVPTTTTRL